MQTNLTGFRLLSFPSELIDRILCQLDLRTLLRCTQVCKAMKRHIEDRKNLQYIMELEVAGLERNENNKWPVTECLDSLQKYVKAWSRLEWSGESVVKMTEGGLWELYGGVLAQTDTTGKFHFVKLPSISRRIQQQETWVVEPNLGQTVRDFSMDPSQDLIVWITVPTRENPSLDIHLRTVRTGEKHPLAKHPVIKSSQTVGGHWHFTVRIMQEYVGLQAHYTPSSEDPDDTTPTAKLFIWNWREDRMELALEANYTQTFAFLSERHVVLANLYISDDMVVTDPSLIIIDFKAEGNTKKTLDQVRHSVTLSYPDRMPGAAVVSFDIFSDPSPGWTPGMDDSSPFFLARDNRLFVVPMRIVADREFSMVHFIPLPALKKCLDRIDLSSREALRLSWAEWASKGTRLVSTNIPTSNIWVCFSYGSRYTGREIVRTRGSGPAFAVTMFNFNQLAIRREDARGEIQESDTCMYMVEPAKIRNKTPFVEEIETSLPCTLHLKTMPIEPGAYSMMCSADNIVLVNAASKEYRIFTF